MKINGFDEEGKLLPFVTHRRTPAKSKPGEREAGDKNVMDFTASGCA